MENRTAENVFFFLLLQIITAVWGHHSWKLFASFFSKAPSFMELSRMPVGRLIGSVALLIVLFLFALGITSLLFYGLTVLIGKWRSGCKK